MTRCAVSTDATTHTLRVGFTLPTLIFTAFNEDEPIDLTDVATVTFKARRKNRPTSTLKISRSASMVDPRTSGRIRVDWIIDDVDVEATYDWWVELLYNDGKKLPVPSPGFGTLRVEAA